MSLPSEKVRANEDDFSTLTDLIRGGGDERGPARPRVAGRRPPPHSGSNCQMKEKAEGERRLKMRAPPK